MPLADASAQQMGCSYHVELYDLCVAGTARADRDADVLSSEDTSKPARKLLQLQPDEQGIKVDNAGAIDNPETGRALLDRCHASLTIQASLFAAYVC
jgi:hypothetical protein